MRRRLFSLCPLIVMGLDESDMDEGEEHPLLSALQIVETLNLMNWVSQLASENSKKLNMITISPSFLLQPFPLDLGRLLSKSAHRSEGIYEERKNIFAALRPYHTLSFFCSFQSPHYSPEAEDVFLQDFFSNLTKYNICISPRS